MIMADRESATNGAGHDAQRDLEQRALRNVRVLVDRIEGEEEAKRRSQKWVVGVLVAVVAVLGVIVMTSVGRKPGSVQEIVVSPPSKAPAR
jgi:cytochrome c-type biogenesis protein CcmH/NrfG